MEAAAAVAATGTRATTAIEITPTEDTVATVGGAAAGVGVGAAGIAGTAARGDIVATATAPRLNLGHGVHPSS